MLQRGTRRGTRRFVLVVGLVAVSLVAGQATAGPSTPPKAPTGLAALAGDSQVTVSWDLGTETDLDRYRLYRATVSGGPYTNVASTNSATNTFVDTSVVNDTAYYYKLAVTHLSGATSALTAEVAAVPHVPDAVAPEAPTNVVATPGDNQVTLSWVRSPEPDVVSYSVYRASSPGGPYALDASVAASSYVDGNASNGTTYFYVVRAVDISANVSPDSNQASATPRPPDSIAPRPPTGLDASAGDRVISLSWDKNAETDLVGYKVYRSSSPGGPYAAISDSLSLDDRPRMQTSRSPLQLGRTW